MLNLDSEWDLNNELNTWSRNTSSSSWRTWVNCKKRKKEKRHRTKETRKLNTGPLCKILTHFSGLMHLRLSTHLALCATSPPRPIPMRRTSVYLLHAILLCWEGKKNFTVTCISLWLKIGSTSFLFFFKDTEVISKSTSSLNNRGNVLLCMSAAGCNTALNCRSRSMNRHFSWLQVFPCISVLDDLQFDDGTEWCDAVFGSLLSKYGSKFYK